MLFRLLVSRSLTIFLGDADTLTVFQSHTTTHTRPHYYPLFLRPLWFLCLGEAAQLRLSGVTITKIQEGTSQGKKGSSAEGWGQKGVPFKLSVEIKMIDGLQ